MLKNLISLYSPKYPIALLSLLHTSKYNLKFYLKHLHQTKDFTLPVKKAFPKTKKTLAALYFLSLGIVLQIAVGILVIVLGAKHHIAGGIYFGAAIILLYPLTWAYLIAAGIIIREWSRIPENG